MIDTTTKYAYNDLTIVPAVMSAVRSRSEIECVDKNGRLPIFVAPMSAVINDKNYEVYETNNLYTVIPRSVDFKTRVKLFGNNGRLFNDNNFRFIAMSLNEFKDFFCDRKNLIARGQHFNVCIDIANGHMQYLYDLCKIAKSSAEENGYELVIMTGNIANPDTYKYIINRSFNERTAIIDYIRCGIGSGAGCFVDGTKIKTDKGEKNIEDICIDDRVLTIDGSYQRVFSRTRYKTNNLLKINNEITCTPNHKFFVINKSDKELVNEQNLEKIGFWIEAENLDKEKHLLVKLE